MRDGRVVDFLRIGIGELRTGIFNVADAAIVLGLACLFASALWLHNDRLRSRYATALRPMAERGRGDTLWLVGNSHIDAAWLWRWPSPVPPETSARK